MMRSKTAADFLSRLTPHETSAIERTVALLWWHGLTVPSVSRSVGELAREIEDAGFGQQNVTRLKASLDRDPRVAVSREGRFRIRTTARLALDAAYLPLLKIKPIVSSDAVLPLELFVGTRTYIEKVVLQLNASYEASLFDCCAVMCRRLLETLIVEVYEAVNRAEELKGPDGHFMMFAGLLAKLENDPAFNLGRNSIKGLRDFKSLGDLSAHNRRFNARADDIDRVRSGLRVAAEELLSLAALTR